MKNVRRYTLKVVEVLANNYEAILRELQKDYKTQKNIQGVARKVAKKKRDIRGKWVELNSNVLKHFFGPPGSTPTILSVFTSPHCLKKCSNFLQNFSHISESIKKLSEKFCAKISSYFLLNSDLSKCFQFSLKSFLNFSQIISKTYVQPLISLYILLTNLPNCYQISLILFENILQKQLLNFLQFLFIFFKIMKVLQVFLKYSTKFHTQIPYILAKIYIQLYLAFKNILQTSLNNIKLK